MIEGFSLRERVALVTGGSRGIGRAIALRLAELGADVAINYVQNEEAAERVVHEAQERGAKALAVQADVSRLEDAERLVERTVNELGRLDILICNAGVWEGAPIDEMTEELWDRVIEVNLKGTWTVCHAAVPRMKREGWGRIVIISSTAGQRGEANVSNYAASKGGQISFTKSLASELAEHGINVNSVAPGWVETDMCEGVFADQEYKRSIERMIPLGRVASADDIACPVVFLCTEWARHITGEILNVNGGSILCG
jgi:3-oxoacyl-[acyl-carrier protein] reductase